MYLHAVVEIARPRQESLHVFLRLFAQSTSPNKRYVSRPPSWVIRDKLEGNVGKPFVCMCTYTYMYISGYFCDASMVWHSNCVCVHVYSSSSSPLCVLAVPHVLLSKHISTTPDYAKKGQPPLSILKLRFPNLNLCRSPAPASPISMLTQDVFFLWPFLASTLKFGVRGRDGLMAYKFLSLSIESGWGL